MTDPNDPTPAVAPAAPVKMTGTQITTPTLAAMAGSVLAALLVPKLHLTDPNLIESASVVIVGLVTALGHFVAHKFGSEA